MSSLPVSLASWLPWAYALGLIPVAFLHSPRRFWWPARAAGYLGLMLAVAAALQAIFNGHSSDRLGLAMAGLIGLLALVIIEYSQRYLDAAKRDSGVMCSPCWPPWRRWRRW
ncbi:NADH:ubiquinone oxidoreductase subunit 5 (subunit L)/multisubunit Na+/H+ antiporter MnhA subunit [Pseudomonas psychrotolerans]|nr:NADH:ubiquinone oxidoreductase subunit 5 (subunit L)/multisubunit Na+/H+ antiporter MnhA subunit [Pseudomonas psychrotolerans]